MPTLNASFVKNAQFTHKGQTYTVAAFVEPATPHQTDIEVIAGGHPVVITYPDGYQATLAYSVSMMTGVSLGIATGINAVDHMMQTAESDIRQLV